MKELSTERHKAVAYTSWDRDTEAGFYLPQRSESNEGNKKHSSITYIIICMYIEHEYGSLQV